MQTKRRTQVKSYSLDILTIKKMEYVLKHNFGNKLGASDLVSHAVNDYCNQFTGNTKVFFQREGGI